MSPNERFQEKPFEKRPELDPGSAKAAQAGTDRISPKAMERMRPSDAAGGTSPLTIEHGTHGQASSKAFDALPAFTHSLPYSAPYGNSTIELLQRWKYNTKPDGSLDGTITGSTKYSVSGKLVQLYWQEDKNGHKQGNYAVESFKNEKGTVHNYYDLRIDEQGRSIIDHSKDRGQIVIHSDAKGTKTGGFMRTPQGTDRKCALTVFDGNNDVISKKEIPSAVIHDDKAIAAFEQEARQAKTVSIEAKPTTPEATAPVVRRPKAPELKAPPVTGTAPEVKLEAPAVTARTPEVKPEAPVVTAKAPEATATAPVVRRPKAPEPKARVVTATAPEIKLEAPAVIAKLPEVKLKAPAVIAKPPEVKLKAPAVTAKALEATAKAPESTDESGTTEQTTPGDTVETDMGYEEREQGNGREAELEQARLQEERVWLDRNGELPTDALRHRYQSGEKDLESRLRDTANYNGWMDSSLNILFRTYKPDSLGAGDTKPLFDRVMQYTDKTREEVLNMAYAAFNIGQERNARTYYRYAVESQIDQLNPYAEKLRDNNYPLERATERLDEFDKIGRRDEKDLAKYKKLQSLRSRTDLSRDENDELKILERSAGHPGEDELRETIQGLSGGVEKYRQERARLEQDKGKYQGEKDRLENLAAVNLSPDAKARIKHLQAKLDELQKPELNIYKTDEKPTKQFTPEPESQAKAFAAANQREQAEKNRDPLVGELYKYQKENNSLVDSGAGLSPERQARIIYLQEQIEKSWEAELSTYKSASEPTIKHIIPESRAKEFTTASQAAQVKDDYSVTFSAQNENGNLAVTAEISLIYGHSEYSRQNVDIAANDPKAPLILAGTEEATLTSTGLKPFSGIEVDRGATLENLRNGHENPVLRQLPQTSNTITFGDAHKQRRMHLNVADGVPVDLRGLKQGTIQKYDEGKPHHMMDLRGAAQVILSDKSSSQFPDFSLSIMDSGLGGQPTVISIPVNNNLQPYDIKFNETDWEGKANKSLTMNLQGNIFVPLTSTVDYTKKVANPVNIDIAVRPPYGTQEPVHIPVVRNGVAVDSPKNIAARVRAASIEMEKFQLTEIASNYPDRLLIGSAYFRVSDAVNGVDRALARQDGGPMVMMMTDEQRASARKTHMKMEGGRGYYAIHFEDKTGEHTLHLPENIQIIGMDANRNPFGKALLIEDAIKDAPVNRQTR